MMAPGDGGGRGIGNYTAQNGQQQADARAVCRVIAAQGKPNLAKK